MVLCTSVRNLHLVSINSLDLLWAPLIRITFSQHKIDKNNPMTTLTVGFAYYLTTMGQYVMTSYSISHKTRDICIVLNPLLFKDSNKYFYVLLHFCVKYFNASNKLSSFILAFVTKSIFGLLRYLKKPRPPVRGVSIRQGY